MFLTVRFKLLISSFIVEDLNVLANDAAEAAEKINQFKIAILRRLCGSRPGVADVKLEYLPLSLQTLKMGA